MLTGIERVMLEERLAAERAAALAAAEAERPRAAEEAGAAAEAARLAAETAAAAPVRPDRRGPRIAVPRIAVPRIAVPRIAVPRIAVPRPRVARPSVAAPRRQVVIEYLLAAVPLVAATVLWTAATVSGRLDLPDSPARLAALSLALTGPAAAVGALAARAWFPRLVGPVLVTALCALLLIGRALFA